MKPTAIVWYPIVIVALAGAAMSTIKTGRDAVFFTRTGLEELPLAYLWSELALFFGAYVHLSAMRRWGSRTSRLMVFFVSAALFAVFVPFLVPDHRLVVQVLYPTVPMVFAAVFASAWLLVGDVLEGSEKSTIRRFYGMAAAAATIGGIGGALFARAAAAALGPRGLIAAGAILIGGCAALAWRTHGLHPVMATAASSAEELPALPDLRSLLTDSYTLGLLAISALGTVIAMYVEFQFYSAAFASGQAGTQFFANYYVLLSVGSLLLQMVVAPWVQSRLSVARSLLILPVGVLGGSTMVAGIPTIVTQSLFRIMETSLKNSIHRSSWEQVFLMFDRERRPAIKVMIDGALPRAAGVLGAAGLFVTLKLNASMPFFQGSVWPVWVLGPCAALWILAAVLLMGEKQASEQCDYQVRLPDS